MKTNYGYIYNSIEVELSEECVRQCAHTGQCDEDVKRWLEMPEIKKQFDRVDNEILKSHIREWGSHSDEELNQMNKHELSMFVLWDLCFNVLDCE